MNREQMLELAAACEAAGGPDRKLDAEIAVAIDLMLPWDGDYGARLAAASGGIERLAEMGECHQNVWHEYLPRYTASLDSAMTLVPADRFVGELNQCDVGGDWYARVECHHDVFHDATAPTAALALTAAALRARASLMDKD